MEFCIRTAAKAARQAAISVAQLDAQQKTDVLNDVAEELLAQTQVIIAANQLDLAQAQANNMDMAMQDRLALDAKRIAQIAQAVMDIAAQPEVVGHLSEPEVMPSGIQVQKMQIPLGVIGMIYESRPNVTIDAAALCF